MANKMLIDAAHPEETRVVVVRGNRVEEFDFESAARKQLRGNIYLAKVTRVEPSLQAAFVDYGGNRHGFLAFNEIHPDYYQIPVADRQALLEQDAADQVAAEAQEDADVSEGATKSAKPKRRRRRRGGSEKAAAQSDDSVSSENVVLPANDDSADAVASSDQDGDQPAASDEPVADASGDAEDADQSTDAPEAVETDAVQEVDSAVESSDVVQDELSESVPAAGADAEVVEAVNAPDAEASEEISVLAENDSASDVANDSDDNDDEDDDSDDDADEDDGVESVGADDALEEVAQRKVRHQRAYKIQEVIKRRQVILVQVVKEERGTKGAALTTYLSLAGRYCVLMPNTARGGGISRKITNLTDRRRIKDVANNLPVPEGMGLIIRTAGANRTKPEIKRDFEYLLRLWENVRDLTLQSSAPCLVYEEGNLIKRSIRDLYNKDVESVQVEGDEAYREAKDFMRMLMPSHAKNVQAYKDSEPVFMRHHVETQLDALFSSHCALKSGGYLVINQTEALVAIDVNSGKSTKEHNIEDTALRTNLEAAEEVARQLRLRDLAGLIVIDFIDMEEKRNNRAVERRMKERLKDDRARIQVGRISHFGLLEMSRQRMRSGVLEGSTIACEQCQGRGFVRSVESSSLNILRGIEEYVLKGQPENLVVRAPADAVIYVINQKRAHLSAIEALHDISVFMEIDNDLLNAEYTISGTSETVAKKQTVAQVVQIDSAYAPSSPDEEDAGEDTREETAEEDNGGRKKRRRRRGKRKGREETAAGSEDQNSSSDDEPNEEKTDTETVAGESDRPKRRRGRRGGRRHRKNEDTPVAATSEDGFEADSTEAVASGAAASTENAVSASDDSASDSGNAASSPENTKSADESANADTAVENVSPDIISVTGTQAVEQLYPASTPIDSVVSTIESREVPGSMPATQSFAPEPTQELEPLEAVAATDTVAAPPEKPKRGWWQRRREASD